MIKSYGLQNYGSFLMVKSEWGKIKDDKLVQQTGHTRFGALPFAIACFESIENEEFYDLDFLSFLANKKWYKKYCSSTGRERISRIRL